MENEELIQEEPEVVDILPLKKGKRILVYLADFFLNFILSFIIFNCMVMPAGKAITNFAVLNEKHEQISANMYSLFYKNNLVIKSSDYPEYDLVDNIDYTFDYYISYYACDDSTVLRKPEYGKKDVNEVLYHYYNDILGNKDTYKACFNKYNTDNLFVEDSTSKTGFSLREDVRLEVEPKFDSRNEIGSIGEEYLKTLKNEVFLPIYSEMMKSIMENDLSHPDVPYSYKEARSELDFLETYHKNLIIICASIGFVFSTVIYYMLIPCIISNKKTVGMLILKAERVKYPTMEKISNWSFIGSGLYSMLTNLVFVFFLPLTYVTFNTLFTFTLFFYICLVSLIFNVAGLLFILFNRYNKSWADLLTRQVYIKNDDLDKIYRSKGYIV